jgi:hypothetical protein
MNGQRALVLGHSDGGSFNDTIELAFSLSSTCKKWEIFGLNICNRLE